MALILKVAFEKMYMYNNTTNTISNKPALFEVESLATCSWSMKYLAENSDFTNLFTSLLPPNSHHVMIHLEGYNCSVCTYSHGISCLW